MVAGGFLLGEYTGVGILRHHHHQDLFSFFHSPLCRLFPSSSFLSKWKMQPQKGQLTSCGLYESQRIRILPPIWVVSFRNVSILLHSVRFLGRQLLLCLWALR